MRPGVSVSVIDAIPPRSAPTDVGTFFIAGLAEKGPQSPQLIRSMTEFETYFGAKVSYGDLYDYVDAYLREGGTRVYVSRVVGPSAVASSATFQDDDPADTVIISANSPGDWGDDLRIDITGDPLTSIQVVVKNSSGDTLETSPAFTTRDDLIGWNTSSYVVVDPTGSSVELPDAIASVALTGGDDDRASITDSDYTGILSQFNKDLGPGQIAIPSQLSSTVQLALLAHAEANNRVAMLDAPDSDVAATLLAAAATLTADANARWGGLFAPPAVVPGLTVGTTREIPMSVLVSAMLSRTVGAQTAAAGVAGESRLATEPKYEYTDAERESLNEGGVNIAKVLYGAVRNYGFRSLADPATEPGWEYLTAARVIMGITAEAEEIGEEYMFKNIDGRKVTISAFGGALSGMLGRHFQEGALYGETPEEAFSVDVGDTVNTPSTIAAGELRANILLRVSPFAELVEIEIAKVPLPTTTGAASLAA